MARKAKIKSSYKASGSSFDCFCTISVRKSKSRSKMRGKMKGESRMDLGYVTVGMVLTLLVLFIAEGICTALREKGGGS